MIQRKVDIPDSPGSNGLRGGRKTYSEKTLSTASWQDDLGGPAKYNRGFTSVGYISENSFDKEKSKTIPRANILESRYGSAINDLSVKSKGSVNDLLHEKVNADVWSTVTHVEMERTMKSLNETRSIDSKLNSSSPLQSPNSTTGRYTKTNNRFLTENGRSSMYTKCNVKQMNRYPFHGTPAPVEKYREQLVKLYGLLSVSILQVTIVGEGPTISCAYMANKLKTLVPDFITAQINQVIAYFSSEFAVSTDNFLSIMIGRLEGFPTDGVNQLFNALCDDTGSSTELPITNIVDTFKSVSDGAKHPFADNLAKCLSSYSTSTWSLTRTEFLAWHEHMFASDTEAYDRVIIPLF